jgi:hypothetical protein
MPDHPESTWTREKWDALRAEVKRHPEVTGARSPPP